MRETTRLTGGVKRFIGPAFIASIAYIDPGNIATNFTAGSEYGFLLIWVVVLANAVAMFIQYLTSKIGIVTGNSLSEIVSDKLTGSGKFVFWAQAMVVMIATEIAEIVGGAIAFKILFNVPIIFGALLTSVLGYATFRIWDKYGQSHFSFVAACVVLFVGVGMSISLLWSHPSLSNLASGFVPGFSGTQSVVLAVGIVGATVMPHAIYLHSSLTKVRSIKIPAALRNARKEIIVALLFAGLVNLSMVIVGATNFQGKGDGTLEQVFQLFRQQLGSFSAVMFGLGLLASAIFSSTVGASAGSEILESFSSREIPLWVKRMVSLVPAMVLLAVFRNPTNVLIWSQVVLSFGLIIVLVPLLRITNSSVYMSGFRNGSFTRVLGYVVLAAMMGLNGFLIVSAFVG